MNCCGWQVEAFFEEIYQMNFGFAILENYVFVVVEVSFGFLLSSENRFEYGYYWFGES